MIGLTAASAACSSSDVDLHSDAPSTASAAEHGGTMTEMADYDAAFPQDRIARLDIVVSAANWKRMTDDLSMLVGEFGASRGQGPGGSGATEGGAPRELAQACEGRRASESCSADVMGQQRAGTCTTLGGQLLCLSPDAMGPPVDFMMGGTSDLVAATPVYVECEVATEDRTWSHVGMRFKGNSSLSIPWRQGVGKLPLRLQFDELEAQYPETRNQRFYGFKNLSLSNSSMDQSLLREKLGTELFAHAGIASPAVAFYRVFLDHGEGSRYLGLYTGIELPSDSTFLRSRFGADEGNLYKPDGTGATWSSWVEASFEKENNESAADYSDVRAAFDALHADRSDAAAWRAGLEAVFDVELFLHWLALNTVVQDWDQYGRMSHNYYLYANPNADGRLQWIPWDHSFAFAPMQSLGGAPLSLGLAEVTERWPLIRFLLDDDHYRARYHDFLRQAVEVELEPSEYESRFREAHDLIAPYVLGEEGEQPGFSFVRSPESFEASVEELVMFVGARQTEVRTYLGELDAGP